MGFFFNKGSVKTFQLKNTLVILKKNAKLIVKAEKKYHKVEEKLLKPEFTTAYTKELERKYLEKEKPEKDKFVKEMTKLADKFYPELEEFVKWYVDIFSVFDQIAIQDSREEYEEVQAIEKIFRFGWQKAGNSFFGHESTSDFKRFIDEFFTQIENDAQQATRNAILSESDSTPSGIGFFMKRRKETKIAKMIRRILSKKIPNLEKRGDKLRDELLDICNKPDTQTLPQEYLGMFKALLGYDREIITYVYTVKLDLDELIKKHIDDVKRIVEHIRDFSRVIATYGKVKGSHDDMMELFNHTGNLAHKFVNDEEGNEHTIYEIARREDSMAGEFVQRLDYAAELQKRNKTIYIPG